MQHSIFHRHGRPLAAIRSGWSALILRPTAAAGNNGQQSEEAAMADELRDILRNRVKEKLARDEVVASMTVRLSRSIEIARIAATAGFDTIYVDVEHNTLSIDAVCQICIAAMQCGITPLVRVMQIGRAHV